MTGEAIAADINLITDRTEFHIKPLLQQFTEKTKIKVNAVYLEEGTLVNRAKRGDADVVISTDSTAIAQLTKEGFTKTLNIKSKFSEPNYLVLSYRIRGLVVRNNVAPSLIPTSYDDLASGKFKVCSRPFIHPYNINMISQMLVDKGEEKTKDWLTKVNNNLGIAPQGNDRKQAELVAKGACDVGIMNSYYYGLMLSNTNQRGFASSTKLVFPDQDKNGSYILMSAGAVVSNNKNGIQLLKFMISEQAQYFISQVNYEYPVIDINLPVMVKSFVEKDFKDIKINYIKDIDVLNQRTTAIKLINDLK